MITANVETIGPSQAKALLELNTENFRKPDPKRVDIYAKEMAAGNWRLNGDTIKLNGTVLLDGQHRLLAIVKANVEIQTIVVRGVDDDGKTIDRGKPRTIGQWCTHNGIKNANHVAAAAKMIIVYQKGIWAKPTIQSNEVIDSEVFSFIESNKHRLQDCVQFSRPVRPILTGSIMAAVLFVGCGDRQPAEVEEAVWFVKSLSKGENLTQDDAVFHFRNRLLSQTPQSRMAPFMKRALLTIAWNKTIQGEPCSSAGMRLRLTGPAKQKAPNNILVASI